jgi:UDP-2,3-diacylglucosamine pyrophosphatase LpxH
MLVFISDLHFVDETAGKHNIPTPAFEKFLTSVKVHADKAKAKELKIVFLGDIFDLLRTEEWFNEDLNEEDRPWGNNTDKMRQRAGAILSKIEEINIDTFKLFEPAAISKRFGNIEAETVYVPGNHDRLCWLIDDLRNKVMELLGLDKGNQESFRHHFSNTEYGVYALHGHCFDEFNYEGGPDRTDKDYKLVPIGDSITTELIAKLPYKLMKNVEAIGDLSPKEKENLKRNFQEIENVRPFSATLKWLLYQVEANRDLKEIIEDTVDEVVEEFQELTFVKKWYDRHDRWYNPFDTADKIQGVLYFLEKFKVFSTGKLLDIANKLSELFGEDELVKGGAELFSKLDSRIQYIVMGHTHDPLKKALALSREGSKLHEHVYLNTGTWRKRYHECRDGSGFIGWKDMTYVMFYTPEEKPNQHGLPVFESWSGSLKREE